MKSIYLELLEKARQQESNVFFAESYYDEDDYDDEEDDDYEDDDFVPSQKEINKLLVLPLCHKRLYVPEVDFQADIKDIRFASLGVLPSSALAEYYDGDIYNEYPYAASFTMVLADYNRYLRATAGNEDYELTLEEMDGLMCHQLLNGFISARFRENDQMRLICGFQKEVA